MAAEEIARGVEAVRRVANVFPSAAPLIATDQWGTAVRVEPGTIWGGDRMFITTLAGGVAFTAGDKLYTQGSGDFIRDYYLIAYGQGAGRAAWLIPIAQAEMAFLMAFVGTLAGVVGTIAAVTVFMAKIAVFYSTHKAQVDSASQYIRPLLEGIVFFSTRCPKLAWLLAKGLGGQAIQSAGQGISAADIAYFLGKLLGGLAKAPELALLGLLKVIAASLAIAVAVRGPGASVHGAQDRARQLVQQLARDGINITESEALPIATENCLSNPDVQVKLREMATNAERLAPIVEALSRALQIEGTP